MKRKPGRPKGTTKVDTRVNRLDMRFDNREWSRLCKLANDCGVSKTSIVRKALDEYFIYLETEALDEYYDDGYEDDDEEEE